MYKLAVDCDESKTSCTYPYGGENLLCLAIGFCSHDTFLILALNLTVSSTLYVYMYMYMTPLPLNALYFIILITRDQVILLWHQDLGIKMLLFGLHGIIVSIVPDDTCSNIPKHCTRNWFGPLQCFGNGCVRPTNFYRIMKLQDGSKFLFFTTQTDQNYIIKIIMTIHSSIQCTV